MGFVTICTGTAEVEVIMKNALTKAIITVIFVSALLMSACKRSDGSEIVLSIAWWGSQTRHDRTMEVIRMFGASRIKPETPGPTRVVSIPRWI